MKRHPASSGDMLPHNLDAERALLGSLLVANEHIAAVRPLVEEGQFYRHAHRLIFSAVRSLHDRGEAVDFVTLKDALAHSGHLDDAGGPTYLAELLDGIPASTNARAYARLIAEAAQAREAIALLRSTADAITKNPAVMGNGVPTEHREAWERLTARASDTGLEDLADAVDVAQEGREIAARGVPQLVEGLLANYGMLGFLIAYAKVGKTTLGLSLAASVAMGRPFLDRATTQARVLVIAAEDPPEYVAWLARHLDVTPGRMTFYRRSLLLDGAGLSRISDTVRQGGFGLVLISSWQAVVRGLVKDENDNAGAVQVVESVKAFTRQTGVPWLIDAHSGKGEDQDDEADPSRAMRGASGAAGAADYTLSLRYANGAFGTHRRLSGKGRFVSFEPILMDFTPASSAYTVLAATKDAAIESTWRLITEVGAVTPEPRTAGEIAKDIGLVDGRGHATKQGKRQVAKALAGRPGVAKTEETRNGKPSVTYRLISGGCDAG